MPTGKPTCRTNRFADAGGAAPADARRVAQIPDEEPPVAVQAGGPLPVRGEPDRRDVRPGRSGGASAAPVGQTLGATHRVKRRGLREGAQVLPGRTG